MQFIAKHKSFINKVLLKYLLPLLLCFSVMRIIISTYFDINTGFMTLACTLYMGMIFFIYEKIKPRKILRAVIFFILAAAIAGICSWLLSSGWEASNVLFINWFYVSGTDITAVGEYQAVVFIFFGFFVASVVYYFSIIRFRASGLMLALLLPFIIYGKRSLSIEAFDMTLMVTVYLGLVFHSSLTADDVKHNTVFNYSYVITALVFVTFVGMITMFTPKPEIESYLENNRNFFDLRIDSDLNAFSSLSEESSDRFGANATGEKLFTVENTAGADVIYLRRQVFDEYKREKWVHNTEISDFLEGYNSSSDAAGSNKVYFETMKNAVQTYKSSDSKINSSLEFYKTADPYSENALAQISLSFEDSFRPSYVPAELNIDITAASSNRMMRSTHSETYPVAFNSERDSMFYHYYPVSSELLNYAKGLEYDTAKFYGILQEMRKNKSIAYMNYLTLYMIRMYYTSDEYYSISARMKQLAQQVTAGCKNDYEKAEAIVHYFETNKYTYDMDYIPPDESIDYFVFESKRGSCTSYATAMTLMARSVGLPTRYVEGFAAYEKDTEDPSKLVVKDTNAHAFCECFIAGVGWMTFDPTVPEYMAQSNSSTSSGTLRTIVTYLGQAALFLGAAFVIIFIILLDRIDERLFRIRNHSKPLDRRTIELYKRVIKLLNRSHPKKFDGHTPEKIDEYVKTQLDGNIELLVQLFQSSCFGSQAPTQEQFEQAYEQYKQSWRQISKGKRPEKPQKVPEKARIQGNL